MTRDSLSLKKLPDIWLIIELDAQHVVIISVHNAMLLPTILERHVIKMKPWDADSVEMNLSTHHQV